MSNNLPKINLKIQRDNVGNVTAIFYDSFELADHWGRLAETYALEHGCATPLDLQTKYQNGLYVYIYEKLMRFLKPYFKKNGSAYDETIIMYLANTYKKMSLYWGFIPSVYQFNLLLEFENFNVWNKLDNANYYAMRGIADSTEAQTFSTLQRSDVGLTVFGNNALGWASQRAKEETEAKIEAIERSGLLIQKRPDA